jgi:hypothetical protein
MECKVADYNIKHRNRFVKNLMLQGGGGGGDEETASNSSLDSLELVNRNKRKRLEEDLEEG